MARHDLDPARSLVLIELELSEQENLGDESLGSAIRAAQRQGLPMTSVALAGGLTRTRAYAVLERTAQLPAAQLSAQHVRRLVACVLDPERSITTRALATELHLELTGVADALRWLREQGVSEILAEQGSPDSGVDVHWIAGSQREPWIEVELQKLRWVASARYAVYVRLPDGIARRVAAAATGMSATMVAVINAGTARAITWDELAVAVSAADPRDAVDTARAVWTDLVIPIAPKARFDVTLVLAPSQRVR